jgi:hypothetical protein
LLIDSFSSLCRRFWWPGICLIYLTSFKPLLPTYFNSCSA